MIKSILIGFSFLLLSCASTFDNLANEMLYQSVKIPIKSITMFSLFSYQYYKEYNNWPDSCLTLKQFLRNKGLEPDSLKDIYMCELLSQMIYSIKESKDTTELTIDYTKKKQYNYTKDTNNHVKVKYSNKKGFMDSIFTISIGKKDINIINNYLDSIILPSIISHSNKKN